MHIYCDMDDTLVDLKQGILSISQVKKIREKYRLSTFNQVEFFVGKKELWDIVEQQPDYFWAELKWLNDSKQLWDCLINLKYKKNCEVSILSAPLRNSVMSKLGKILWVHNNCGKDIPVALCDSNRKYIYSKPKSLLIDDKEFIGEAWKFRGGSFILHIDVKSTIESLKQMVINFEKDEQKTKSN